MAAVRARCCTLPLYAGPLLADPAAVQVADHLFAKCRDRPGLACLLDVWGVLESPVIYRPVTRVNGTSMARRRGAMRSRRWLVPAAGQRRCGRAWRAAWRRSSARRAAARGPPPGGRV